MDKIVVSFLMMNIEKFYFKAMLLSFLLVGLVSCEHDPEITYPGQLVGEAFSYAPCELVVVDKGGVVIDLIDSISNKKIAVVQTDTSGRYVFRNIPSGIYNLYFSRPDVGPYRIFGHHFTNKPTDTVRFVQLAQKIKSLGKISAYTIDWQSYDSSYSFYGETRNVDCNLTGAAAFMGKSDKVSYTNYTEVAGSYAYPNFYFSIRRDRLLKAGFKRGETVWVAVYLYQLHGLMSYDPTFRVKVLPNLDTQSTTYLSTFTLW